VIFVFKKLVLADLQLDRIVERFEVDGRCIIERQDYPESDVQKLFDRFNIFSSFSFVATRQHDDEEDAQLFALTHHEDVLGKGPLLIKGSFKGWERFFNEAACENAKSYDEGVRTWTSYQFTMGLSSKKKITTTT
jgi:hypothetical protein